MYELFDICSMNIKLKLGMKIKEVRLSLSMSQEQLADKACLHRTYISSIELGARNVSIENIEKIAIALECEVSELV